MKQRAVYYARVSTDEEKQLNALEKQIQENKDVIASNGWKLVDEYIDEGKSGTSTKRRNEYKRLLKDLSEDKFDIVVCKDQDRLQRNTLDWYLFVNQIVTNDIKLFMYLDNKYFSSNEDALITGIKAIIAEEYSRNLSKKLNNTNKRRIEMAKQGFEVSALGNGKALGYKIENKRWVKVPQEIELALFIWDLYEKYDSIRKVRDILNNMGYRNSVGKPFSLESISRVLKNEKAKGILVMGRYKHDFDKKRVIKTAEENWTRITMPELAYVSEERWQKVNDRLKSKTIGKRGKYMGADPLSGKIFCGKCGSVYWRRFSNGYISWYCSKAYSKGSIICNESNPMSRIKLKKIYAKLSEGLVVNREVVKESIITWLEETKNALTDDTKRKTASLDLQKVLQKREKLTEIYLEGIISKDEYKVKYADLNEQITGLQMLVKPVEDNKDVLEIKEILKNIDAEIDAYINLDEFEDSKIDFLIEHTKKITVDNKHLIIELDLIGGAIIAGEDFLLFVHDSEQLNCVPKQYAPT